MATQSAASEGVPPNWDSNEGLNLCCKVPLFLMTLPFQLSFVHISIRSRFANACTPVFFTLMDVKLDQ